jgi:acetolactate synthase I/II/III large subunit
MLGMDSWLEVPQSAMVASVVKKAWRVERGSEAARIFADAYSLAASAPYGPTFVEVPEDVWSLEAGSAVIGPAIRTAKAPTEAEVASASKLLASAKKPLVVVGGGINTPEGGEALQALLSRVEVPVVSSGNGRGAVPEDNPLSLGRIGFGGGNRVADSALVEADAVLCVGCGLSDVSTYGFNLTPKGEVIIADLDPLWDRKPVPCAMHAACDATEFVRSLALAAAPQKIDEEWKGQIESERKGWDALLREAESRTKEGFVNPAKFLRALDGHLPRDAILAVGQGLHVLYAYSFLKVRSSRSFLAATNMGSMGFVFPAAVGAKLVFPERETVGVMGDGEFMMTMQDLETAVREKAGVKIVIVNDNSYRVLLMRQKIQKMGRVFGTTHSNPDFAKVAEAFGAEGIVVDSDTKIQEGVDFVARESDEPLLVELRVDPEDLPPLNIQGSLMF